MALTSDDAGVVAGVTVGRAQDIFYSFKIIREEIARERIGGKGRAGEQEEEVMRGERKGFDFLCK